MTTSTKTTLSIVGGILVSGVVTYLLSARDDAKPASVRTAAAASSAASLQASQPDAAAAPERQSELPAFTSHPSAVVPVPVESTALAARSLSPGPDPSEAMATSTIELLPSDDPDPSKPSLLDNLLDASRIRCSFSTGGSGYLRGGKMQVGDVNWGGGDVTFDAIEVESGTAQMLGTAGATGSKDGATSMRVAVTRTGMHFSGFTRPRGDLIIVTIYNALDASGHYVAVMSQHQTLLGRHALQVYGGCDSPLPKLNSAQ